MKSQLKTSYLHRQEGKIKPKNYMKKLINQNKVILFSTKYINYTNYEVFLKMPPILTDRRHALHLNCISLDFSLE